MQDQSLLFWFCILYNNLIAVIFTSVLNVACLSAFFGAACQVSPCRQYVAEGARMNNYSTILFDLDGTLLDTKSGVFRCIKLALRENGLPVPPDETLIQFLGPPLLTCFTEGCSLDMETAEKAAESFTAHYSSGGMYDAQVFEGIPEVLQKLKSAGKTLCVATSKNHDEALAVLSHFKLDGYFDTISGSRSNKWTKCDSILSAIRQTGSRKSGCVMVGDRKYDADGAHEAGIACIGVLYGYGPRGELLEHHVDTFAGTPQDLLTILL